MNGMQSSFVSSGSSAIEQLVTKMTLVHVYFSLRKPQNAPIYLISIFFDKIFITSYDRRKYTFDHIIGAGLF